jgi:hypothetical protein
MSTETPGNPAARELGYCPCCGYLTLSEGVPGSYEVCPVCHWTDDPVQFVETQSINDSNPHSLETARKNFERFGAITPSVVDETRDPTPSEQRDPNWPY